MRIALALVLAGFLLPAPVPVQERSGAAPVPLSDDERILHLLNRFTPGATPELVQEVRSAGWSAWLDRQLKGDLPESESFQAALKEFETIGLGLKEIFDQYSDRLPKGATEEEKREAKRRATIPTRETLAWVALRIVGSANGVREAWCDFFRNHFAVSIEKGEVRFFVIDWEREVIFKNGLTSFSRMLDASARHPAMLFYLDNCLSRRPATPEELKAIESRVRRKTGSEERAEEAADLARQRGLNENYARELMELHTLGVDNEYTQADVINVAKCLTGWTIGRREAPGFRFDRQMHCPGDKIILGTVIKEDKANPQAEGEEVLSRLCKSKGTAAFLARKLCLWFVNDEPSTAMVGRVAKVFHETGGDFPKVIRAIVDDPEFFARSNFRSKFKRPWEFIVSALRVTHADANRLHPLEQYLSSMNEPLYRCSDPTGYYDQAEAWCDPGAMATRWAFASDLAQGKIGGVKISPAFYRDLPAGKPHEWKDALVKKILPVGGLGRSTSSNIDRLIDEELKKNPKATAVQLGPMIVALLLGSPEFQKQ